MPNLKLSMKHAPIIITDIGTLSMCTPWFPCKVMPAYPICKTDGKIAYDKDSLIAFSKAALDASPIGEISLTYLVEEGEAFYKVEKDMEGCSECGHGALYSIVHAENGVEVAESTSYETLEDAQQMCDDLNTAYEKGLKHGGQHDEP